MRSATIKSRLESAIDGERTTGSSEVICLLIVRLPK